MSSAKETSYSKDLNSQDRRKVLTLLGTGGAALASSALMANKAAAQAPESTNLNSILPTTIAALRANRNPLIEAVYYVRDRGQEGYFRYDALDKTSHDNTGVVLVSTSGARFKRSYSGAVNVTWFGAKGDGNNDDTDAIQAALDQYFSIFIPDGIYSVRGVRLSDAPNTNGNARKYLFGSGKKSTFLKARNNNQEYVLACIKADDMLHWPLDDVVVGDIGIDGGGIARVGLLTCVQMSKIESISIFNTLEHGLLHQRGWSNNFRYIEAFQNKGNGLTLRGEANNMLVGYCESHHNGGHGMVIESGSTLEISNTGIEGNAKHGILVTYQRNPAMRRAPYVQTHVELTRLDTIYFESNGHSDPATYSNVVLDGEEQLLVIRYFEMKNCHFAGAAGSRVVHIKGGIRDVKLDIPFVWDVHPKFILIDAPYNDASIRKKSRLRISGNVSESNIEIVDCPTPQPFIAELLGTVQRVQKTFDGLTCQIEKLDKSLKITLNGRTKARIQKEIDFTDTGIDLGSSEIKNIVATRIYGYKIETRANGKLWFDIPDKLDICQESFTFYTNS